MALEVDGSNPFTHPSRKKHAIACFFQRCLPLRASDVAFSSDVHCMSDVTPHGVVSKHHITLRLGAIHHYERSE